MKIKINSRYPLSYVKLNWNCLKEEKVGSGPGSCSGASGKVDPNESPLKSLPKVDIEGIKKKYASAKLWERGEAYDALSKVFMRETFKPSQGNQQAAYESILKNSISLMEEYPSEFDTITFAYTQDSRSITKLLLDRPNLIVGKEYGKEHDDFRAYANDNNIEIPKFYYDDKDRTGVDDFSKISVEVYTANKIARMDNLFKQSSISEPITVYSGLDPRYFDKLPKTIGSQFEISAFISSSRNESIGKGFAKFGLQQAQEGYDLYHQFIPGEPYAKSDKTMIEFQLKPGTKAIATEPAQAFAWTVYDKPKEWGPQSRIRNKETDSQEEIIINRKTRFEVIGLKESKGLKKLIVKTI